MNWRDLECQTINPCICNSLYRHLFLINHYCFFCLFESVGKTDLLSNHFDSKQSREAVDPLTCHPSASLTTFVFRSSEVRRLFLDLYPYGGTDPLGMFPIFLKKTADVMAPRLSVVFRRLVRLCSFPACWRQANISPIPKCPPSSSVENYRPISHNISIV